MISLLIWITTMTAVVASLTGMVVYIGGPWMSAAIVMVGATYIMTIDDMVSVLLIMGALIFGMSSIA